LSTAIFSNQSLKESKNDFEMKSLTTMILTFSSTRSFDLEISSDLRIARTRSCSLQFDEFSITFSSEKVKSYRPFFGFDRKVMSYYQKITNIIEFFVLNKFVANVNNLKDYNMISDIIYNYFEDKQIYVKFN